MDDAQIVQAQVTDAQQLQGICDGVEVVISCLGITRQRDGLSYADVDYGANLNLLLEAECAGVKNSSMYRPLMQRSFQRFACSMPKNVLLDGFLVRPLLRLV